jgi:hypothetical protein
MNLTPTRLFAILLGPFDDEVPDVQLRNRVDRAMQAVIDLLLAAELTGRVALIHGVADGRRVINVDAETPILERLTLLREASRTAVPPADAARRVIDTAVQEIGSFIASQQPITLASLDEAAKRVRTGRVAADGRVIGALRREPGQSLRLSTRGGELVLSLQSVDGNNLLKDVVTVICGIEHLGKNDGTLSVARDQRKQLPWSLGRKPLLKIPSSLATDENMRALYAGVVLANESVSLKVRGVEDRKTGKVVSLQLEVFPLGGVGDCPTTS